MVFFQFKTLIDSQRRYVYKMLEIVMFWFTHYSFGCPKAFRMCGLEQLFGVRRKHRLDDRHYHYSKCGKAYRMRVFVCGKTHSELNAQRND